MIAPKVPWVGRGLVSVGTQVYLTPVSLQFCPLEGEKGAKEGESTLQRRWEALGLTALLSTETARDPEPRQRKGPLPSQARGVPRSFPGPRRVRSVVASRPGQRAAIVSVVTADGRREEPGRPGVQGACA